MFSTLPSIEVPDFLSLLCEKVLKDTKKSHSEIQELVESNQFAKVLTDRVLKASGNSELSSYLTQHGWKTYRDSMSSFYIFYAKFGKFPEVPQRNELLDVLEFEKKLDFLTLPGNSRVFLLGIYLRLCDLFEEEKFKRLNIDEKIIKTLNLGKSRGEKPDWLIVMIIILNDHLGSDKLFSLIESGGGALRAIFADFEDKDFTLLMDGLVQYGHGISELEFFLFNKV